MSCHLEISTKGDKWLEQAELVVHKENRFSRLLYSYSAQSLWLAATLTKGSTSSSLLESLALLL